MSEIIDIDGSHLEGGGAILRVGLALSAVTGKPCRIFKIRAGRCNPGLQAQHLEAVKALARICNAEVKGASIGSTEVDFAPKELGHGKIEIKIPTAGSVGLVLQGLMVAASHLSDRLEIEINGGATNGKWAAPVNYIRCVLLPVLDKMGYEAGIDILRYGYYPKGGARVSAWINPCRLKPLQLVEQGKILAVGGISHSCRQLENAKVAERQSEAADKILYDKFGIVPQIEKKYADSECMGSAIDLWAKTEQSVLGSEGLGERGKTAEKVGTEAAHMLMKQIDSHAPLDEHMADQILPYIALAASSSQSKIKVADVTQHCLTNIWVIEKFLPVKFAVDRGNKIITCRKV